MKFKYITFAFFYGFFVFMMIGLIGTLFGVNIAPLSLIAFILWLIWNIRSMNKDFPKWEKFIKKRMSETKKAVKDGFEFITKEPKK